MNRPPFIRVGERPRLYVADNFLTDEEIEHIKLRGNAAEHDDSIRSRHDSTGFSFEMSVAGDEITERVSADIHAALRMGAAPLSTFRFRRYAVGESHPPHLDTFRSGDTFLLATAILYLDTPDEGGGTALERATPEPVVVDARRGRLAAWFSHRPDGSVEELSWHEGLPVLAGTKTTATAFIYRTLAWAARVIPAESTEAAVR